MHCLVKRRFIPCFYLYENQIIYYSTSDKHFTIVREQEYKNASLTKHMISVFAVTAAATVVDVILKKLLGSLLMKIGLIVVAWIVLFAAYCWVRSIVSKQIQKWGHPYEVSHIDSEMIRAAKEKLSLQMKAILIEAIIAIVALVICIVVDNLTLWIGFVLIMGCLGATVSVVMPFARMSLYRLMEENKWK